MFKRQMSIQETATLDPRIRRTRQLLQDSLRSLLEKKDFDKISVQDIADEATLNRATFYDHYTDKAALLQSMVAIRFQDLLTQRRVSFESCCSTMTGLVAAVCDFLAQAPSSTCAHGQLQPYLESAIVAVVRDLILEGLQRHTPAPSGVSPEMVASTLSWAIFGACKEWLRTPDRAPSERIAPVVAEMVTPLLAALQK
jgi:AcrR family transcriptional regulator